MIRELLFKVEALPYRHLLSQTFTLVDYPPLAALPAAEIRERVEVLVTSGHAGATRGDMASLPALSLICCVGTGYENVDLDAARERGILVSHGAGTNAGAVADHAFALLLAVMRDIPRFDASARRGDWRGTIGSRPIPTGKRLGLIGMGGIGERVAVRAAAFDMEIAYHTRRKRTDLPWRHFDSALALADEVDCLVVAAPGGPKTRHMVDAAVLAALGARGFLVNVGRGSIVDTQALVAALRDGVIAGAGLDVYEDEPSIPQELREMTNVVLTPHVAAHAPEVQTAAASLLQSNIELFLSERRILTPIPEIRGQALGEPTIARWA